MTSVSPFVLSDTLASRETRNNDFTTECVVSGAIFENSTGGINDKINKMEESGSPGLGVNEVVHQQ